MQISEKQLTPAGKRQSSRNATRPCLLASLHNEFEPNTPTEYTLLDNLAAAQWRRPRLWTMESSGDRTSPLEISVASTTAPSGH